MVCVCVCTYTANFRAQKRTRRAVPKCEVLHVVGIRWNPQYAQREALCLEAHYYSKPSFLILARVTYMERRETEERAQYG